MYNENGESRGYCFITFENLESAQAVIDNYDHNMIDEKWVDCKPSDGGSATKPGDWICPMCGDIVFAKRAHCNMCGFGGMGLAVATGGKPGDWMCPSCGDLVFSYRDKCHRCGTLKENGAMRVGSKKGDWTCPSCGDLVFASKSSCTMCGTLKPMHRDDWGCTGGYGPTGSGSCRHRVMPY